MANMELYQDCKTFCERFNQKAQSQNLKLKLSEGLEIVVKEASLNFGLLYYELGKAIGLREETYLNLGKFVTFLANMCHSADGLVDLRNSRETRIKHILILGNSYSHMRFYLDNLGINYEIISEGFREGIELFKKENELANKGELTEEDVQEILAIGNPDFKMYNRILYQLLPKQLVPYLEKFFENYMATDLVLDHLCDYEQDQENGSFNPIRLFGQQGDENKALEYFVNQGQEFGRKAQIMIGHVESGLANLLKFYVDGEIEGLNIFQRYDYFLDIPKDKRKQIKTLVLKPHPWERYSSSNLKWTNQN